MRAWKKGACCDSLLRLIAALRYALGPAIGVVSAATRAANDLHAIALIEVTGERDLISPYWLLTL